MGLHRTEYWAKHYDRLTSQPISHGYVFESMFAWGMCEIVFHTSTAANTLVCSNRCSVTFNNITKHEHWEQLSIQHAFSAPLRIDLRLHDGAHRTNEFPLRSYFSIDKITYVFFVLYVNTATVALDSIDSNFERLYVKYVCWILLHVCTTDSRVPLETWEKNEWRGKRWQVVESFF